MSKYAYKQRIQRVCYTTIGRHDKLIVQRKKLEVKVVPEFAALFKKTDTISSIWK